MDDRKPGVHFGTVWNEVIEECRKIIDDDEDYELIVRFESYDQMLAHLKTLEGRSQSATHRLLHRVSSHFQRFPAFAAYILLELGGQNLSAAGFLGASVLLVDVASQSEGALKEISGHLSNLSAQFKLFEEYRKSLTFDPDSLQSFFDILVGLTLCTARAIRHFRRNDVKRFLDIQHWGKLDKEFKDNLTTLAARLDEIHKLAEARSVSKLLPRSQAEIMQRLEQFKLSVPEPSTAAACSTIPHLRNQGFYGRATQLNEIAQAFKDQASLSRVRTVAIWGTGGIGKSQIALEYAHKKWDDDTYAVLWIASETAAEIAKSFNEAAGKLRLDGYSESNTPDKNRHLVLQWLQTTDTNWFVIFDNIEDENVLQTNRPNVGQGEGEILITCRSDPLAASLAASSIEIPPFSTSESTELIFKILNKSSVDSNETEATDNLSGQLGGLALAIDVIAKNIKTSRRFKTVADFLPYYEQNRRALNKRPRRGIRNFAYSKDLETVWETAFERLNEDINLDVNPDAASLLQLLCLLAPEAIPQSLFETEDDDLPEKWKFLADTASFDEAKLELLDLSLIRINMDTGLISIHRLIQNAYFDRMDLFSKISAFGVCFTLLRNAFPGRDGESHFYKRWAMCEKLHQHVQALHRVYGNIDVTEFPKQSSDYHQLVRDDAWYMLETQQFIGAEKMLISLLPDIDESSFEYAHISRDLLGIYERTGRSIRAVECAESEFRILEESGLKDNDVANAYSDMGYTLCSAFKASEALPYLDKAIEIAKSHPEPDCYAQFNLDRFLRNHGRANQQLKKFDDALADFKEAEDYQLKVHGEDSHYDGETTHERAKIAAWRGSLEEAAELNLKAMRLVSKGKPNHSSVSATLYRQGWVLLSQQDYDDALIQFDKALAICQLNEPQRGNSGESARIRWRMAQIHELKGQWEDAKAFMDSAQESKTALLDSGEYAHVEDEDSSWDALLGLLYR